MALTPQEQAELDKLELEQLEAEYAASQKAPATPAAPAPEPAKARPARLGAEGGMMAGMVPGETVPGAAQAARYGVPLLGATGGLPGVAASGAGEKLAQLIEGSDRPGDVGQAMVMGGVPLGGARGVWAGIKEALKLGAAGAAGKQVQSLGNEGRMSSVSDTIDPAALPVVLSMLGRAAGRVVGAVTGNVTPEELARVQAAMKANVGRDAAIEAGQRVGMKPIPSMVNRGNRVVDLLESLGGSGATKKAFAEANDAAAAQAALKHANVPPGMPLVDEALDAAEGPAIQKYSRVESIGNQGRSDLQALKDKIGLASDSHQQAMALEANAPQLEKLNAIAGADMAAWKEARKEVGRLYSAPYHAQDPKAIDAAEALADSLEAKIVKAGEAIGDPELLKQIEQGRREFAKVNDVRRVMNQPGGSINTRKVGAAYQKDPDKMTGELADVGAFANQFKEAVGDGRVSMDPGNSGTNVAGAGALLLKGQPLAAAATFLNPRQAARSALMSDFIQQRYARPNYAPDTSADPVITAIIQRLMLQAEAERNRQ
jgi:hypothetical protein